MQATWITTIALPLALAIIMFGLGLHLRMQDFYRVLSMPKPVLLGLGTQMLLLPPVAFLICKTLQLPGELAAGVILLAASPGGATANVFSHLARGDVALNITLTALNSLLILITLPLLVAFALGYFLGAEQAVPAPTQKVFEVAAIVLLPVAIGMFVRAKASAFASKLERLVQPLSLLILLALIVLTVYREWQLIVSNVRTVGLACVLLNLLSLLIGYGVARLAKLPRAQAISIAFEVGIHNTTLAIFIALSVLQLPALSVPAALYSLLMYFTAGASVWLARRAKTDP
jgi:bile acid:Na+ symporter, BASS family